MPQEITRRPPAAEAVIAWLVSGAGEREIRDALRDQYPTADAKKIMAAVQADLASEGNNAEAIRGWAIVSYRDIYRRMLQEGDLAGAAKVVKHITDLIGL